MMGLLLLLTLTMFSCVKDGILRDCLRRMRIELRWIGTNPRSDQEVVNIEVIPLDGGSRLDLDSDIYGVNVDLQPGNYSLVGWESSQNVNLNTAARTVSVNTSAEGFALEPDIFSAGVTTSEVPFEEEGSPRDFIIPLPMYRQARPLIIEIDFIGAGIPLIEGIRGILSGVTLERTIDNGFPPVSELNQGRSGTRAPALRDGSIDYNFEMIQEDPNDLWFAAGRNLLGIDGTATQQLELTVTFADGQSSNFGIDVTEDLTGFHTIDVNDPLYIIITLDLGVNFEIEIVDWRTGTESWITAH